MKSARHLPKNMRLWDGKGYIAIMLFGLLLNGNLSTIHPKQLVAFTLASVLYVGYAFSINNCFDTDTDSLNARKKSKNPVVSGKISRKLALIFSACLITAGILIVALAFNTDMFITYVTMCVLATLYSAPPRLKATPFLDVLSHGLFFGTLPVYFGAFFDGTLTHTEIMSGVAFFVYSCFLQLRNLLEDYESDLKAGLRTTPSIIGVRNTTILTLTSGTLSSMLLARTLLKFCPLLLIFPIVTTLLFLFFEKEKINKILDFIMTLLCLLIILSVNL